VAALTREGQPNIQARAAVIVDLSGGGDYYAKNPDAVRPIASISKLMAAILVLDQGIKLDATTTITKDDKKVAWKGARSRMLEGTTFYNRDLLHAALIASDNRAVPALGRAVGLSPEQMAKAMTRKAHALGLVHTEFKDPTGLDDGNVSTPRETVRMLQVALKNPVIAEILKKPHYVVQAVGRGGSIEYTNTDMLVRGGHWQVFGGKTGYTDIARYCLVVAAHVGDREVGMAFLGAEGKLTRFGDFTRAADWLLARADLKPQPPATAVARGGATPAPVGPAIPASAGAAGPPGAAPGGGSATTPSR
jgi:D-alanyl-D-alanine endopeptidase (penicillin-binding protein 7)